VGVEYNTEDLQRDAIDRHGEVMFLTQTSDDLVSQSNIALDLGVFGYKLMRSLNCREYHYRCLFFCSTLIIAGQAVVMRLYVGLFYLVFEARVVLLYSMTCIPFSSLRLAMSNSSDTDNIGCDVEVWMKRELPTNIHSVANTCKVLNISLTRNNC